MDFGTDDFEGTHRSITQWVHVGNPPWSCINTMDIELAYLALKNFHHVAVQDSATARLLLIRCGMDPDEVELKIQSARYGPASVYHD